MFIRTLVTSLAFCTCITHQNSIKVDVASWNPYLSELPLDQDHNVSNAVIIRTSILVNLPPPSPLSPIPQESRPPTSEQLTYPESQLESSESVHITALYRGEYNHWNIDLGHVDYTKEKTLCSNHLVKKQRPENISIGIFSTSREVVSIQVDTLDEEEFLLELDEEVEFEMDGISSKVFQFLPDVELHNYGGEADETYLVAVKSISEMNSNCLYVAVNPPGCPWYDSTALVRNSRLWARMLNIGYYPVRTAMFPNGFVISIIPVMNSSECTTLPSHHNQSQNNTLKIQVQKTLNSYSLPIGLSVGVIVATSSIFFAIVYCIWKTNMKNHPQPSPNHQEDDEALELPTIDGGGGSNGDVSPHNGETKFTKDMSPTNPENAYRHMLIKDIKDVYDSRCESKSDHCQHAIERLKKRRLYLSDLTRMSHNSWHRRQRSKAYLYLVPLLSIFYLIPSAQMVYTELTRSRVTGNLEQCYLNYGCSRPYGELTDFNHVISNIGYWIYGSVFVFLVFCKSKLLPEGHRTHEDHLDTSGPLQQHSIFYTVGICMILQGCFSAIFHLCPSNISLQFDTTMMYIMMILVFIKIFQLRHPDTAYNAYHTMYVFSVVLAFEALTLYVFNTALRIVLYVCFVVCYLFLMIHMAVDIYYYGAIKTSIRKLVPVFVKHAIRYKENVLYKRKFFLSGSFIVINLFLLIFIMYRTLQDPGKSLSTPLLIIGGTNVGLYLLYYFSLKLKEICTEKFSEDPTVPKRFMRLMSFIFFFLALVIGIIAGVFYAKKHQSRNSTPPESRNKNELCGYLDFFDNHDMWHFTSSTALFLAFIGLLIIDDDLLFISRDKIPVF